MGALQKKESSVLSLFRQSVFGHNRHLMLAPTTLQTSQVSPIALSRLAPQKSNA